MPGATVVGRLEAAAMVLREQGAAGGEKVCLLALAADDPVVDAGHLSGEAEAREAAAKAGIELLGDEAEEGEGEGKGAGSAGENTSELGLAGTLRAVAFALMAAPPASTEHVIGHSTTAAVPPHALPAPETANDWALPPPVTAANGWAEDRYDAPAEALGHRRGYDPRPAMDEQAPLPRWYVLTQQQQQQPSRATGSKGPPRRIAPVPANSTDLSRAVWTPRSGFRDGGGGGGGSGAGAMMALGGGGTGTGANAASLPQTAWDSLEFEVEAPPGLGFRVMQRTELATRPLGGLSAAAFGVTKGAATPNTATVWKRRYTWHSDVAVRTGFTHTRDTFIHLLQNKSRTSGPAQPSVFTARLDFERLSRVDSTSLSEYFEEERRREEKRAELRRREAEAAEARAVAEEAEARARERADLAMQWRDKSIRDAARLRGTSVALGLARGEWESMRADPRARMTARHAGWERWVHVEDRREYEGEEGDEDGGRYRGEQLLLEDGTAAGNAAGGGTAGARVTAVWYYQPEQEKSSWDPPSGWPEVDASAAEGASLEDALREDSLAAGSSTMRHVGHLGGMAEGDEDEGDEDFLASKRRDRGMELAMSTNAMVAGAAPVLGAAPAEVVALATLRGAGAGAAADPLDEGEGAAMRAAAASGAVEECIYRAFERGFRRWAVETACRECVDPASKGNSGSSEGGPSEAGAVARHDLLAPGAAHRSMMEAATVVDDAEVSLDRARRLTPMRVRGAGAGAGGALGAGEEGTDVGGRPSTAPWESAGRSLDQSIGGSSGMLAGQREHGSAMHPQRATAWDDRDVSTLTCGLDPGSGGESGSSAPWRPSVRDAFDLGHLLRLLDRDGDGTVSLRDWAKATGAETAPPMDATEAMREAARHGPKAPPPAPVRPEDKDAAELVLASVWPYFCASLARTMPPALRPLLEETVPGLLDEDAREALGLPMEGREGGLEDGAPSAGDHVPPLRPLGQCDGPSDAARRLRSLLSPGVRLRVFLDVKRARAFPERGHRDKARAHTSYGDWMRWAVGSAEGGDWFGLGSTLGLFLPVKQWHAAHGLRNLAEEAAEFAPAIDPASGAVYWVSSRTGASVWSKGKPQLRADSAARFQAVARLDMEERAEERLCRAALRRTAAVARAGAQALGLPMGQEAGGGDGQRGRGYGHGHGALEEGEHTHSGSGDSMALVPSGGGRGGPPATSADVVAQIKQDPQLLAQLAAALGLPQPPPAPLHAESGGMGASHGGAGAGHGGGMATIMGGTAIGARVTEGGGSGMGMGMGMGGGMQSSIRSAGSGDDGWEEGGGQMVPAGEQDQDQGIGMALWGDAGDQGRPKTGPPAAPGAQWRRLRPPKDAQKLRARAREARVLGAQFSRDLNLPNVPAVVGLVAPVDVSVRLDTAPHPTPGPFMVGDLEGETDRMKMVVDPRTGEKRVQQVDPTEKSEDDRRAETVRLAFSLVRAGKMEELRDVLSQGVLDMDRDRDEKGNTLVITACQNGNKRLLKELLRRGADPNVQNSAGNTALHFLFAYGFRELGEYLVSKGADDTIQNHEGLTAHEGLSRAEVEAL